MPAKIIKSCISPISSMLANLINNTFQHGTCKFIASLKGAQVVPIHKKNVPLNKENYRPLSVLPITSKAYERVIHNELSDHFNDIFNPLGSISQRVWCQSTLLGQRPWTTISLQLRCSLTCLRHLTASPMVY